MSQVWTPVDQILFRDWPYADYTTDKLVQTLNSDMNWRTDCATCNTGLSWVSWVKEEILAQWDDLKSEWNQRGTPNSRVNLGNRFSGVVNIKQTQE